MRKEVNVPPLLNETVVITLLLLIGIIPRILIAPYTSHGYDINVHKIWLFRLLKEGPFFYISSKGIELFGEYWGHDPNFCELPPIFPLTLLFMGKMYALIRPELNDVYLLVMFMKIPQIIAECLTGLIIYLVIKRESSSIYMSALAASLFLFNPFTFFSSAVWGTPESIVALFVIASLYMIYYDKYFLGAFLLGCSIMVKPYAIIFLIPMILFSYQSIGARGVLVQFFITVLSALLIASPWLIVQGPVFIDAMWSGAVHNLGVRIPKGTIWAFPSFWLIVNYMCKASGFPYEIIAPIELYIYVFLASVICFINVRLRLNDEKRNLWFTAYLFLFSFMMFFPSAHEKWIYSSFPQLLIYSFLILLYRRKYIFLISYLGLMFILSGAIYGTGQYLFESTEVLPMPRTFIYGGILAEKEYYFLRSAMKIIGGIFVPIFSAFLLLIVFLIHLIIQKNLLKFEESPKKTSERNFHDQYQTQLDRYLIPSKEEMQEETSYDFPANLRNLKKETEESINAFNLLLARIKEIHLETNEIEKMFRSDEINERIYLSLMKDLMKDAFTAINSLYALRENLEFIKTRSKIEWAREKIKLDKLLTLESQKFLEMDSYLRKKIYMPINEWEEIISKIDATLASLTLEEELSIIEQYLSSAKKAYMHLSADDIEKCRKICQWRLNSISKNWSSTRDNIVKQISDLKEKIFQVKQEIKEAEIRFAIGEFDRNTLENIISHLQASLKSLEKRSSKLHNYLHKIDEKLFKCLEIVKGKI